jgi:hypothetical protein
LARFLAPAAKAPLASNSRSELHVGSRRGVLGARVRAGRSPIEKSTTVTKLNDKEATMIDDDKSTERERHLKMARHLGEEAGVPEATAIEVYERELERLSATAHVTQFLHILTAKSVKAALRSRRAGSA